MIELQQFETNDLVLFINIIKKNTKDIIIYGTGIAAREMYEFISYELKRNVICFVDRIRKESYCGLPVCDLAEIKDKDNLVIIAASTMYDIEKRLDSLGLDNYIQVDPFILQEYIINKKYLETNKAIFDKDLKKINEVYDFIEDEKSKTVFNTVIQQRINPTLKELKKIYDKNQYFGNDVIPLINGNIVDCGAYDGDTLIRFLQQKEIDDYKYFAFEADKNNYEKILTYIKSNGLEENVYAKNVAIWDKQQIVNFSISKNDKEGVLGKIDSSLNKDALSVDSINADSLDNLIPNNIKIDLIIMDIEGAEINALHGAKKLIRKFHPCLAISAYHDFTHLYEIPLLIKKIYPDYKIYYRHHRWNVADTVCYAIP
jgi:FkbM family methyltransferase